jgi:hypothetical protein
LLAVRRTGERVGDSAPVDAGVVGVGGGGGGGGVAMTTTTGGFSDRPTVELELGTGGAFLFAPPASTCASRRSSRDTCARVDVSSWQSARTSS